MSYSYERVTRERRRAAGGGSYGASSHRSTFGYWVPLALTVTAATIGLAAWIWSERRDDDEDTSGIEHYPGRVPQPEYTSMSGGLPPGPGLSGFHGALPDAVGGPPVVGGFQGPLQGQMGGPPPGQGSFQGPPTGFEQPQGNDSNFPARSTGAEPQDEATLIARMSGALKRTPSPQQSYDWASKKVSAGVAAAGAMVGGALSAIQEGSQDDYEDHERWSEEAESKHTEKEVRMGIKRTGTAEEFFSGKVEMPKRISQSNQKRKNVAVVVSAVEKMDNTEGEVGHHASSLSHLPEYVDSETTRVFVLIYAPALKVHPLSPVATARLPPSMTSSFSNISQADAHTPGEFPGGSEHGLLGRADSNPIDESSSLYKTLHNQAQALVEKDTMIMPFTSTTSHVHLLRSLAPEIVYIQESLCGDDGEIVTKLSGWVKQTVVVIGDEGGHGGLVDTDDEASPEAIRRKQPWWQKEERTGLGKRVTVVDSLKIQDDWRRRVNEQD